MENKPRRYFTCPIQAAYMKQTFAVEFENEFGHKPINFPIILKYKLEDDKYECGKIYVTAESEAIFKIRRKDLIEYVKGRREEEPIFSGIKILARFSNFVINAPEQLLEDVGKHYFGVVYDDQINISKIIMRDQKHFFMGELENAE